jgi:hypothetical protein
MDNKSPSRSRPPSAPPKSTCKAHYWGVKHCPLHRVIPCPTPDGAFILFPKLPPELRHLIWRFAVPTTQRIVHVQQKLIDYDTDASSAEGTRPTRTWEDENGEKLSLDVGTDAYGTRHVQGQLERFGFTSPEPTPMLDSHERYTGYEYFRDHLDDKWLYSACHSDVENLAQACRDSREAVKARYELAFSNRFGPARTWFDFETDVLYLGCEDFYFHTSFNRYIRSPFNMSIFDLRDLRRVKQLAVQYPRSYCMGRKRYLEEAVRYAGNLDHVYLVEGDSSEFDRSDLRLIQFDHAATRCQYTHMSWDDREKVAEYLFYSGLFDTTYDEWMESLETDLNEFYDECMDKGNGPFSVPNIELVSVVCREDYHHLSYWTQYIYDRQDLEKICADERRLEDDLMQQGLEEDPAMFKLRDGRAARHIQQMVDEATGVEDEVAAQIEAETSRKLAEDFRMIRQYEAELKHQENQATCHSQDYPSGNSENTVPSKKEKGTILGYFHYIGVPNFNIRKAEMLAAETVAAMNISWCEGEEELDPELVALADQREDEYEFALENEAMWGAEQMALAEQYEYEHGYEADIYPD